MDYKKYILSFLITSAIFATAVFASNYFSNQKIESIRNIENTLSTNILSLETQFDLLETQSCETILNNPILSDEINNIAKRLSYMENSLGTNNYEVVSLKKQYSLLEIKDFLLMQKVSKKCGISPTFVLYFYANDGNCKKCDRQGKILTAIADEHPELRVYSFDYRLELSALRTLIAVHKVKDELPALIIDNKAHNGFMTLSEIAQILPEVENATSTESTEDTASSTKKD